MKVLIADKLSDKAVSALRQLGLRRSCQFGFNC